MRAGYFEKRRQFTVATTDHRERILAYIHRPPPAGGDIRSNSRG